MNPRPIPGVALVSLDLFSDARGGFECLWEAGASPMPAADFQPSSANVSYNRKRHTLRGMHYQAEPHGQAKLVTCVHGRLWDVVVDLRKESEAFGAWTGFELGAAGGRSLFIPRGCAHGFLTLADDTTVVYLNQGAYRPDAARGFAWDDAEVGIDWPISDPILSDRDRDAPAFAKR